MSLRIREGLFMKAVGHAGFFSIPFIFSSIIFFSCSGPLKTDKPRLQMILTSRKLLEIQNDVRFTRFYYNDGRLESGLMLRWMPDSIRIQERGQGLPRAIPVAGINKIETITGYRTFEGFALGTLIGAVYFAAVGGYDLGSVTFGEALIKLVVPPAIIVTGMVFGASREKIETFIVPPDFLFDNEEAVKKYHLTQ